METSRRRHPKDEALLDRIDAALAEYERSLREPPPRPWLVRWTNPATARSAA